MPSTIYYIPLDLSFIILFHHLAQPVIFALRQNSSFSLFKVFLGFQTTLKSYTEGLDVL